MVDRSLSSIIHSGAHRNIVNSAGLSSVWVVLRSPKDVFMFVLCNVGPDGSFFALHADKVLLDDDVFEKDIEKIDLRFL